ncbi:hypothetical protein [Actinacidiphila oryziradicis]|uniref:Uncharacterized protein n=1 Tax=Actinacidiphila oryziradicis TaxID=2571141 RepID=A0A4U0SYR0_9ACTN|nr:hypothetical protein [Actinacidiphila oryziradicis]TKA13207.1 hypothetical protein FCI23_00220 [Actinacidiphila oryziradicis]
MNAEQTAAAQPARVKTARAKVTLSDIYADRELTDAQVRRLVTILGLTQPSRRKADAEPRDTAA